jgi:Uma2 family endonuclease
MATVETKPMTAHEFFDWVHQSEHRDRFFELDRGEIVEMPPPGKHHGFVCANVARILGVFAAGRKKGYVCTNDSGLIVERHPDTVRGVDVVFYEDSETTADMERQYSISPPVLAAEVMSPNDRINAMMRRVTQLLNFGVKLVWVIDPQGRDVSVCRLGQTPRIFTEDQELTGEDVLPDFRCRVADFFVTPGSR